MGEMPHANGAAGVPGLLVLDRCTGPCGKAKSPREIVSIGTGGAKLCWDCWQWHIEALRVFQGELPSGCQECGQDLKTLAALAKNSVPDGELRMYVHPKDGIYAVLCWACSERYERANTTLYRDTEYGWKRKLK